MEFSIGFWNENETVEVAGNSLNLSRRDLLKAVFEAADEGHTWIHTSRAAGVPMPVLRSVVLYCLSSNICSSEEIVENSDINPAVRYLCAHHLPDWQTVHEFRRRNLPRIQHALVSLFREASRLNGSILPEQACSLAAQDRLRRAIQADSIVLDV